MSIAQLAVMSFLARYSGPARPLDVYTAQLRRWFAWCEATAGTRWAGSSEGTSSSTCPPGPAGLLASSVVAMMYSVRG